MRILILSNLYPPGFMGGYELGASEVASGLARRGHEIHVLTSSYFFDDSGRDLIGEGAPVIHRSLDCVEPSRSPHEVHERCRLGAGAIAHNLRDLAGFLQRFQPDAVLCFNLAGLGAPSILRLLVASGMCPVVYLMDNVFATLCADPSRKRGFDRVFSTADWPDLSRFLFMSQSLRDEVEDALGCVVRHGKIVPGWFDGAAEAPIVSRENEVIRFVFASRIAGHKGVDIMLDACRLLLDGGCAAFSVDIYGAGEVGMTLQRLTALRLHDHLRYQGAPRKALLMPLLPQYDALLFPTAHREPFGFVVPEAAIAGCIPVMTFGIGASEWFLDGVDCLKTARDAASLQAAMLRVVSMPSAERTAMRERAQATARRFLRFEDALLSIEATLKEASAPPMRPRSMEAALAVLTETWRARPHG